MKFREIYTCLFIVIFLQNVGMVKAITVDKPQVLIINQIRGSECCSPGALEYLKMQLESASSLSLPTYFSLRYDVLKDKSYLNLIKDYQRKFPSLINIGIFLEITPSLTEDSGLTYTAPLDRWYEAQTAYSIGYSDNENKILMDKLFTQFYELFGYYPQLTTAWIIDTGTHNYISKKYGVKVHQLTREQWGTDSYTLY